MTENDRVFDAFRNCITEPKCKDCPWTECDTLKNRIVEIPIDLALAVMRMLKAQEAVKPILARGWYWCGGVGCRNSLTSALDDDSPARKPNYCEKCGRAVKWDG